jgi:hypothetical protein
MRFTRVHVAGGALLAATAAFWLFFVVRLSEDVVGVQSRQPVTTGPRPVPAATRPAMSDDAIRELRITIDRAARDTLLTR